RGDRALREEGRRLPGQGDVRRLRRPVLRARRSGADAVRVRGEEGMTSGTVLSLLLLLIVASLLVPPIRRRLPERLIRLQLPACVLVASLLWWHAGVSYSRARYPLASVLPTPWEVLLGIAELARKGLLLKYTVSSLFRVTWAYLAA